jgi:cobyrinic acid a,c-diamide synthase
MLIERFQIVYTNRPTNLDACMYLLSLNSRMQAVEFHHSEIDTERAREYCNTQEQGEGKKKESGKLKISLVHTPHRLIHCFSPSFGYDRRTMR